MAIARSEKGGTFFQAATGRWAGEQMLRAMKEGRALNASVLRTCDTLRKDEWKSFDDALVAEGEIRLRGVRDLIERGLTFNVANALGKTLHEYETVTDMDPALTSLDGMARTEDDRQEFTLGNIPLPITHKDFNISIRMLESSRSRGESLDTTQVRTAGRLVAEKLEKMLFQGGETFGGSTIYGYTNHPNRNTAGFVTNGNWSAGAKTGENILEDVLTMKAALAADRFYGPYALYIPAAYDTEIDQEFKANSDKPIRQRLLEVDMLDVIQTVDQMPADNVVMVQLTSDVVQLVDGEGLQTVQWDMYGGMQVAFKAMAIQVPLVRADAQGRSGVFHMS